MAGITDREPFSNGQRFFLRSFGGLGLLSGGAEAGEHALQSEGGVSFRCTRVALLPAVDDRTGRLSDEFLSDRLLKYIFHWFACPAMMTNT